MIVNQMESNYKSVRVTKIRLNHETLASFDQVFQHQKEFNSDEESPLFFNKLNTTQQKFLQNIRLSYKVICSTLADDDFQSGQLEVAVSLQINEQNFYELMSKRQTQFLLIARKPNTSGFLYFGFIDSTILTQKIITLTLKTFQESEYRSTTFNQQQLLEYLKIKLNSSKPQTYFNPSVSTMSSTSSLGSQQDLVFPSSPSDPEFQFKKKLSKQERFDLKLQRDGGRVGAPNQGSKLFNFLDSRVDVFDVPNSVSHTINKIPILHQEYLFQSMIKNMNRVPAFEMFLKSVMGEVGPEVDSLENMFVKLQFSESNVLNQACAAEYLVDLGDEDHGFKFVQQMEVEENPMEVDHFSQNLNQNVIKDQSDYNEVSQSSNPYPTLFPFQTTLPLKPQQTDEEIKDLMQKITKVLTKEDLKKRSIQDMAIKFIECRENGTLTLDTTPDDLIKMKINVGKNYSHKIHELYMRQLKRHGSNYNCRSFENIVRKGVNGVKRKMFACHQDLPSGKEMGRFWEPMGLEEFCEVMNRNQVIEKCSLVDIKLNGAMVVKTIMKFSKQGGCVYISINDFHHVYDTSMVLSRSQHITPEKITSWILKNNPPIQSLSGHITQQTNSLKTLGRQIEQSMVMNLKDYVTLFYGETSGNRKLTIMIKVRRFNSVDRLCTLKFEFVVVIGKSEYDVVEAHSFRVEEGLESEGEEEGSLEEMESVS